MRPLLLIALVVLVGLGGCNKYEEGPALSLRSALDRVAGTKKVVWYKVNGVDSLSHFLDVTFAGCENSFVFTDEDDTSPDRNTYIIINCVDSLNQSTTGKWRFVAKNKTKIYIRIVVSTKLGIQVVNFTAEWNIVRLTKEEMWLERTENGKSYELRFEGI